jgi:hypothetical protein
MTLFDEPSRKSLPQPTFEDIAYSGRKVLAGMIPVVGGVASELLGLLSSPLAQRRDDWLTDLERRLRDLEGTVEGFHFDGLAQNEEFVSATLQATQAALRTHQREKLDALRTAVINVALGKEPNPNRQQQFLALVDRFTAEHLTVLRFFDDPGSYFAKHGQSIPNVPIGTNILASQLVSQAMPELAATKSPIEERTASAFQFTELLISDLVAAKLITLHRSNETWSIPKFGGPRSTAISSVTTHLGNDFLAFITAQETNR